MTEFEQIYQTYFDDVYLYLKRLTKDESAAEELTSDTFFKAMQALSSFRGDCSIRIWLCQIAKNCYFSRQKRQRTLTELDEDILPDPAQPEDIDTRIAVQNEAERIHVLLHEMPEPYKEVFMLRVFGELSFKQIGKIFGKTENWACVTYHRAKEKIARKMEGQNNEKHL